MITKVKIALAWRRFGPYHHARAAAARACMDLTTLELSPVDNVYAWESIPSARDDHHVVTAGDADVLSSRQLWRQTSSLLDSVRPDVLVIPGWGHRWSRILLRWAVNRRVARVVMSESNAHDAVRSPFNERLKRLLLRQFNGALVGGSLGSQYIETLGFEPQRIALGYDAVDNSHFAKPTEDARRIVRGFAPDLPFFLASARFIQKKNLEKLVDAYARYRTLTQSRSWDLVILGDGPLREHIERRCHVLGVMEHVKLPGFRQYRELPAWYAIAEAFVLPSTSEQWGLVVNEAMAAGLPVIVSNRCGCAPDLVYDGFNGFSFEPHDVTGLAEILRRFTDGEVNRGAMGRASQNIVSHWGLERFSRGVQRAVEVALLDSPSRLRITDRIAQGVLYF